MCNKQIVIQEHRVNGDWVKLSILTNSQWFIITSNITKVFDAYYPNEDFYAVCERYKVLCNQCDD